jgi:hypothetical protein
MLAQVTNTVQPARFRYLPLHNYHLGNPDNPQDLRY